MKDLLYELLVIDGMKDNPDMFPVEQQAIK